MDPMTFLESVSGYQQDTKTSSADRPIKLGVIPLTYNPSVGYPAPPPLPTVRFEGESVASVKTYPYVNGYIPSPGDRVVLVPIGHTYLIIGKTSNIGNQGFYSDGTTHGVEFGSGSYFDSVEGLVINDDATIVGSLSVGGIGKRVFLRKTAATSRTTATASNDNQLAGLALGIGVWEIKTVLLWTGTTGDFQNGWAFTGTWTGLKGCVGASPTTELNDWANTTMRNNAAGIGAAIGYLTYGHNSATTYSVVREDGVVDVTVAGTMAISWAQQTTDVAASALQPGSYIRAERIA